MKPSRTRALGLAALLVVGTGAASAATVSVGSYTQQLGDTFDVSIIGTGFDTLTNGGDFTLAFDPAILQASAAPVDTAVWEFAGLSTITSGLITFSVASFSDRGPDFNIATVTFNAIGLGLSALDLEGDPWAAPGGIAIDVTYLDGSASVSPVPLPAAAWLLLSAVGAVGAFGVRRRENAHA